MASPTRPQPSLFDLAPELPDGMVYQPAFIRAGEERELADWLGGLPFRAFEFHGFQGRRQVVSFGWRYDFSHGDLQRAQEIPAELGPLQARAAALAGRPADAFQQVLINKYEPGAPIGWHRDRPVFAEVVGVSLLAPCTFRLRRRLAGGFERISLTLEPRSVYLLAGAARSQWEHSIPPAQALRYSITFRSFRAPPPPLTGARE